MCETCPDATVTPLLIEYEEKRNNLLTENDVENVTDLPPSVVASLKGDYERVRRDIDRLLDAARRDNAPASTMGAVDSFPAGDRSSFDAIAASNVSLLGATRLN